MKKLLNNIFKRYFKANDAKNITEAISDKIKNASGNLNALNVYKSFNKSNTDEIYTIDYDGNNYYAYNTTFSKNLNEFVIKYYDNIISGFAVKNSYNIINNDIATYYSGVGSDYIFIGNYSTKDDTIFERFVTSISGNSLSLRNGLHNIDNQIELSIDNDNYISLTINYDDGGIDSVSIYADYGIDFTKQVDTSKMFNAVYNLEGISINCYNFDNGEFDYKYKISFIALAQMLEAYYNSAAIVDEEGNFKTYKERCNDPNDPFYISEYNKKDIKGRLEKSRVEYEECINKIRNKHNKENNNE